MKSRKELKALYKQMKTPMGVFRIRNLSTNRILIDYSTDMPSKWNRHRTELRFGGHRNRALQKDWNDLGEDNFVFEVLSELEHTDDPVNDYTKELKTLLEMVLEALELPESGRY